MSMNWSGNFRAVAHLPFSLTKKQLETNGMAGTEQFCLDKA